jgi:multicomponent Na+:H+ antiporter subunit E
VRPGRVRLARAILRRTAIALLLWLALTGGDPGTPLLAGLVIVCAVAASLALLPPLGRLRPLGLLRFLGFFAYESVLGGVDVARRAFAPGELPVRPAFVERRLRLPTEPSRLLLTGCLSLLPGTLSAELDDRRLVVHVLDTEMGWDSTLDALEEWIAALFGIVLLDEPSRGPVSGG